MKKIITVSFLFLAALTVIPAAARDLKSPEPDSQKQEKKIPPQLVSVDFDKAQLSELVLMVSEFTGAAFVFDDDIENPVTWSQRNIPKDELIPTFIDVLTALDYTVSRIEGFNDFWSIKSDPTLSAGALSVSSGIYQLKNLSADAVMDSAEILYGEKMAVYGYEDNQVVSFSGSPKLVTEFITLLQRIDIPALRDESGVLSLTVKHISVKRAVQALVDLQIFKGSSSKKTSGSSKKKGTSKSTTKSVGTRSTFPVFPDYWHSAILVFGTHKQQDIVRTVLAALDKPEQGQNDAVVFLHTVTADQVLPILEESFGDLRIHAYSENRLHLSGESSLVLAAVTMARRLDGTGQQVKVEAVVAYLTDSQFRELGTRFAFTRSDLSGSINDGLSSMVLSSNPGMLLNFFDGIINVDLTAKDSTGKGKIISSPVLTVLNDHEAQIMIGRNVPFISKSKQDNEDGEGEGEEKNTISVDRHDVGLSFTVQPSIQPGGDFIALTVAQELSNVAEDSQLDAAVDLVVDKKSLSSTVLVGDGDTILLGGLRSDETATSIEQVPFLGELPLLGPLFSYESEKTESLHLVVSLRVQTVSAPYALNKRALL
jgi:general secretion pathway protein D